MSTIGHPEIHRIPFPAIAKHIIAPQKQFVQPRGVHDAPAHPVVQDAGRLVEGTGSDAVGAVRAVDGPEIQTGFSVDVPFQDAHPVGDIVRLGLRCTVHDALAGTFFGAFFAGQAKVPDAELNGPIRNQRQIRQDLGQAHPGAELRCDQQAVAGDFTQPGIDRNGNAAGGVVAAGDGLVTQSPDVLGQQAGRECHAGIARASRGGSRVGRRATDGFIVHFDSDGDGIFKIFGNIPKGNLVGPN